jgi:hypothetical protein
VISGLPFALLTIECGAYGDTVNRSERWVAILLFGTAIFSTESAVRAASPANPACARSGIVGLLKTPVFAQRQKTAPAKNEPSGEFQQQIAQAQKMAQAIYDEGLSPNSRELEGRRSDQRDSLSRWP